MNLRQLLFVCLQTASLCGAYTASASLKAVNDANFKHIVLDLGVWTFVDFYADWCRHCKLLAPVIEKLADAFEPHADSVQVVKINGDLDGKRMSKKYVDQGYPTMLMFHGKDDPIEYNGSRDFESIANFIQLLSGIRLEPAQETPDPGQGVPKHAPAIDYPPIPNAPGPILELSDINFGELVLKTDKKSVIVFSASWCQACKDFAPILETLANTVYVHEQQVQFGKVVLDTLPSDNLAEQYGIQTLPSIRFVDKDNVTDYTDKRDLEKLVNKINTLFNVHRNTEGELLPTAGRIKKADELVAGAFSTSTDVVQAGILLEETLSPLVDDSGASLLYYSRLAQKIARGEEKFLKVERMRLQGILENDIDKIRVSAAESMQQRRNILDVFLKHL